MSVKTGAPVQVRSPAPSRSSLRPEITRDLVKNSGDGLTQISNVLRSPGQPLDPATRAFMEQGFNHDFSRVRVHSDGGAAESARAVHARAYTIGSHIVLGAGHAGTGTLAQRRLLTHELTHVVQQADGGQELQRRLRVSEPGSDSEREAEIASERVLLGEPFRASRKTGLQISRLPVEGSATSISWIDPSSPAGAQVSDPAPPATVSEGFVTGNSGFRFSNHLHAQLETPDSVHATASAFLPDSGIYRGPSFAGVPSYAYPMRQRKANLNEGGVDGVEFQQTVGARTISPGVIGGTVGAGAGIVVGIWGGGKAGAAIGLAGGPIGSGVGAVIGAIVGGIGGWAIGSSVANSLTNFPPIWTRIKLRLFANGRRSCDISEHSRFPSNSFYCGLSQTGRYSALAAQQTEWENSGWGSGDPWNVSRPSMTP